MWQYFWPHTVYIVNIDNIMYKDRDFFTTTLFTPSYATIDK